MGSANKNQLAKLISIPYIFSKTPLKIKLVGVPIKVAIPPIDAAYAIDNINAFAKRSLLSVKN